MTRHVTAAALGNAVCAKAVPHVALAALFLRVARRRRRRHRQPPPRISRPRPRRRRRPHLLHPRGLQLRLRPRIPPPSSTVAAATAGRCRPRPSRWSRFAPRGPRVLGRQGFGVAPLASTAARSGTTQFAPARARVSDVSHPRVHRPRRPLIDSSFFGLAKRQACLVCPCGVGTSPIPYFPEKNRTFFFEARETLQVPL